MERITSSAIQSLADYGDSDEEISEEVVEVDDQGTVRMERVVVRPPHSRASEEDMSSSISGRWFLGQEASAFDQCMPSVNERRAPPSSVQMHSISLESKLIADANCKVSITADDMSAKDGQVTTSVDQSALSRSCLQDLPPCDPDLERKFDELFEQKQAGFNFNAVVQQRADFRNPSIYQKLVEHFEIDEMGTNFPKDQFDPHGFQKCDYYEELARAQNAYMARLKLEKGDKDDGAKSTTHEGDVPKRKSKWGDSVLTGADGKPTSGPIHRR